MSTAQTCLALIDMHAPRLLGNKPTIASLRIDEATKNAIRAQGFTIKDAPPSLAANTNTPSESSMPSPQVRANPKRPTKRNQSGIDKAAQKK